MCVFFVCQKSCTSRTLESFSSLYGTFVSKIWTRILIITPDWREFTECPGTLDRDGLAVFTFQLYDEEGTGDIGTQTQ